MKRPVPFLIAGSLIAAMLFFLFRIDTLPPTAKSPDDDLKKARRQLIAGQFNAALHSAEDVLAVDSDLVEAHVYAADAAAQLGFVQQSLEHLSHVPDAHQQLSLDARLLAGSLYASTFQNELAEREYQRALLVAPDNVSTRTRLVSLLSRQSRRWEALPLLLDNALAGIFDLHALRFLATPDAPIMLPETEQNACAKSADPCNWLAAACSALTRQDAVTAERLLKKSIRVRPNLTEAHLRYGQVLVDQGRFAELEEWGDALPENAETFPATWFIRGQWSHSEGQPKMAVASLQTALEMHPNHSAANYLMAQILTADGQDQLAEAFRVRAKHLRDVIKYSSMVSAGSGRQDTAPLKHLIAALEALDRSDEAAAWGQLAMRQQPLGVGAIGDGTPRVELQLKSFSPQEDWTGNPVFLVEKPEFTWHAPDGRSKESIAAAFLPSQISFSDVARSIGVHFNYHYGTDDGGPMLRLHETMGGGVAVVDFDLDAWPDLYFSQAGTTPPFSGQSTHLDCLFRNCRGTQWSESAQLAGIADPYFGQGVAAGDVNNDGFPDLYVANIDGNRLYVNNGDGTFLDATRTLAQRHNYWTTSCAIADVTGDSVPDLYDVTYLDGDDALTRVCGDQSNPRACDPSEFSAAPDVFLEGDGCGKFRDHPLVPEFDVTDGSGLAIVAGRFGDDAALRIFIANDGRPNFYFSNQDSSAQTPLYANEALQRGIASDALGRPQACMGIATADFDGNLRADIFVTNFSSETNGLYMQLPGELYREENALWGLSKPSRGRLGFGTQALDADNDGWPDLIVVNGHIYDRPTDTRSQRMPVQFFRNHNGDRFHELAANTLGKFFDRHFIGRSVAALDWNRDGRAEVAISNLRNSASLLQNTTADAGRFIEVRVVGIESARDAVGTRLVLQQGTRRTLNLITAGDGYQCSNQKIVTFGLGEETRLCTLDVMWPSGIHDRVDRVPVGSQIILREGDSRAFPIP